jgi:hypothetical protein
MSLLPDERSLVWSLRDVPEGPLRDELLALFKEILADARNAHCAEAQADGVPCACLGASCAECERALSRFRGMRGAPARTAAGRLSG